MAKHTPGPWAVGYPDDQTIRADGLRVASVECPRKEWRANARLIAAAPDMLQALRDIAAITTGYDSEEIIAEIQGICARIGAKVGEG